jgi:hypothetical protein
MQAKVETKPANKEEIFQQMMPEIPYDPEGGKKPTLEALPEIRTPEGGKKPTLEALPEIRTPEGGKKPTLEALPEIRTPEGGKKPTLQMMPEIPWDPELGKKPKEN